MMRARTRPGALRCLAALLAALILAPDASAQLERILPGAKKREGDESVLTGIQAEIMDFSDELVARVSEGVSAARRGSEDPAVWRLAHILRLSTAENAVSIAGGPNPLASLLDMVTMVTLMRQTVSTRLPDVLGERAIPIIEAFRSSEERIWSIAADNLTEEQFDQLANAIASWRAENADLSFVAAIRLNDFVEQVQGVEVAKRSGPSSILSFFYLDPLAGLDPTTREIEQARLLGERVVYLAPRLMKIARWHAEMLVYDLRATPTGDHLIANLDKISEAAAQLGDLTKSLPELVAQEREAALASIDERLTAQRDESLRQIQLLIREERAATLADLEAASGPVQGTLTELRATIQSAEGLAVELRQLVAATDALAAQFKSDDEPAGPRDDVPALVRYREAIEKTTAAATELTALSESLKGLVGEAGPGGDAQTGVRELLGEVRTAGDELLDALLWRALLIVVVAGLVGFAAGAGVRRIPPRRPAGDNGRL